MSDVHAFMFSVLALYEERAPKTFIVKTHGEVNLFVVAQHIHRYLDDEGIRFRQVYQAVIETNKDDSKHHLIAGVFEDYYFIRNSTYVNEEVISSEDVLDIYPDEVIPFMYYLIDGEPLVLIDSIMTSRGAVINNTATYLMAHKGFKVNGGSYLNHANYQIRTALIEKMEKHDLFKEGNVTINKQFVTRTSQLFEHCMNMDMELVNESLL